MGQEKIKLLMCFSLTGTFKSNEEYGQLNRYLKYIGGLSRYFGEIHIISYDTENYSSILPSNCYHHPMPKWTLFPKYAYILLSPFIHMTIFRKCDVYRPTHINSSIPSIVGKILFKKPIIAGYNWEWSKFLRNERPVYYPISRLIENIGFKYADVVVTATQSLSKRIKEINPKANVMILPNFVDTDLFKPLDEEQKPGQYHLVVSIGRLVSQKNYKLLIKAVSLIKGYKIKVMLIGKGNKRGELIKIADDLNVDLEIIELIENEKLPELLNKASVFVLSSLYEGHPKALLEAMAAGLPVVGTNVDGIRDVITDGKTGILCELTPESLSSAMKKIMDNPGLAGEIGENGRGYAIKNYSMETIIRKDAEIIQQTFNAYNKNPHKNS